MALILKPGRRFINKDEAVTYDGLNQLSNPVAILEPESIGLKELNLAQINSTLAALPLGLTRTHTLGVSTDIAANSTVLLPMFPPAPIGSLVDDIVYFNSAVGLQLRGFIQMNTYLSGGMYPTIRVYVTNMTTILRTLSSGLNLYYIVQSSATTPQPATTGHAFTVTPGTVWAANDPITITKLNNSGLPTITAPLLYAVDINGAELKELASKNVGKRATFTVNSAISVPVGSSGIFIGSVGIVATGQIVLVSQPLAAPLFVAFQFSTNVYHIYANNQTFGTVSVPAGTVIKVIVI